jgi:uncharacterized protein (DUF58 family)
VGVALTAAGIAGNWPSVFVLGAGLVVLLGASLLHVLRRPRLAIVRALEPSKVQKGSPAIALIHATNLSRRTLAPIPFDQRLGDTNVRAFLPRLRRKEQVLRTYRLPTAQRGVFDIGPVEVPRADPFGLCRTVQRMGESQRISVHPRLLSLQPLPTGASLNLEGPSSDSSPQGSITFHRIREYVVGDELRKVHWPSTAKTGKLMVRHNVDTAQPYTVVLLDLNPDRYSEESFEEAVDVAASVLTSLCAGRAPVQLRLTNGDRVGGPFQPHPSAITDYLTEVKPSSAGSLQNELLLLRRDRGGTALVALTGILDPAVLPSVATLRRRFDRVIAITIDARRLRVPVHPGLTVISASNADELARTWNTRIAR